MLLDGASGIMLVLGISVVLNIIVFMYFRNRVTSLENKVDVMFQIVQEHANTTNRGGGGLPQGDMANDIGIPEGVMNLQPETGNLEQVDEVDQHNIIDDQVDESDDSEDDDDDNSENNDNENNVDSTLKVVDMNESSDPNQLIQVSDDDDDDSDDDDDDDDDSEDDDSDYENNNEGALANPNLVISGSLMESNMVNLDENDPGIIDVVDLPVDATVPGDSIKTLNIGEDLEDDGEQSLAESDDSNLNKMQVSQLRDIAKEKGIKGVSKMKKKELISLLTQ